MKRRKGLNNFIVWLVVLTLIFSMVPFHSFAETGQEPQKEKTVSTEEQKAEQEVPVEEPLPEKSEEDVEESLPKGLDEEKSVSAVEETEEIQASAETQKEPIELEEDPIENVRASQQASKIQYAMVNSQYAKIHNGNIKGELMKGSFVLVTEDHQNINGFNCVNIKFIYEDKECNGFVAMDSLEEVSKDKEDLQKVLIKDIPEVQEIKEDVEEELEEVLIEDIPEVQVHTEVLTEDSLEVQAKKQDLAEETLSADQEGETIRVEGENATNNSEPLHDEGKEETKEVTKESEEDKEADNKAQALKKEEKDASKKSEIVPMGTRASGVVISEFSVGLKETKAWVGQQINLITNLNISSAQYDLAGTKIQIVVPKERLELIEGSTLENTSWEVTEVGTNKILTYTFNSLSPSVLSFPSRLKTLELSTPDNYKLPVTVSLMTPGGTGENGETYSSETFVATPSPFDIVHNVLGPSAIVMRVNGSPVENTLRFGGLEDPKHPGYIGTDNAVPIVFSYEVELPQTGTSSQMDGLRTYASRKVVATLPTYEDALGTMRTAELDSSSYTDGWVVSGNQATLTVNDERYFNQGMPPGNEDIVRLGLKFPGAKADGVEQYNVKFDVTFNPLNPSSYEESNFVEVPGNIVFRLQSQVQPVGLTKSTLNTAIPDQLYAKQQPQMWNVAYKNNEGSLLMQDIVITDFNLDSHKKFVGVGARCIAGGFVNGSNPGRVDFIAVKSSGEEEVVAANVEIDSSGEHDTVPQYALPEDTISVKLVSTAGSRLLPGKTIKMHVYTLIKDPVGTVYQQGVLEKFTNNAKGEGNYTDGSIIVAAEEKTVASKIDFRAYRPEIMTSNNAKPATVVYVDQQVEFVYQIISNNAHTILPPDGLENPVVLGLLPYGMVYDSNAKPTITYSGISENLGVFPSEPEVVENYQNTGRTAVIWRGTRPLVGKGLNNNTYVQIVYRAKPTLLTENGKVFNDFYFGWSNNKPGTPSDTQQIGPQAGGKADLFDIGGGGNISHSRSSIIFTPPEQITPTKVAKGHLNNIYLSKGQVEIGGTAEYRLQISNNHATYSTTTLQVMDILPRAGVGESQFSVYLTAAATTSDPYTIEYATNDPMDTLAYLQDDSNWGAMPDDSSKVTAIRFTLKDGESFTPGTKHTMNVPVRIPEDPLLRTGMTSLNRMYTYFSGESMNYTTARLEVYGYSVYGKGFTDVDKNGYFDNEDTVLKGVNVQLFNEDGTEALWLDNTPITATTDDEGNYRLTAPRPGNYYVAFRIPENMEPTEKPDNADSEDHANHGSLSGNQSVTSVFELLFNPGDEVIRNAGFYTNKVSFTATKEWANLPENALGATSKLQLLGNGEAVGELVDVSDDGSHEVTYTWNNLPKYASDGSEIDYSVDEPNAPKGYVKSQEGNRITNTYNGLGGEEPVAFTATKRWAGLPQGADGVEVSLQLRRNNEDIGEAVTITDDGTHEVTYTWNDLLRYAPDSSAYVYTVDEPVVPKGYVKTQKGDIITNTYDGLGGEEPLTFTATKEWANLPENALGATSKLQLLGNGEAVGELVDVSDDGTHEVTYTWSDLLRYAPDSSEISYTVDEPNAPKGYVKSQEGNRITNTYDGLGGEEPLTFTGMKEWANLPENALGATSKLQLLGNGEVVGELVDVSDDGTHEAVYTWRDLLRYAPDSSAYVYTVDEPVVPKGYVKTQEGDIITNTYDGLSGEEPVVFTATKRWAGLPDGMNGLEVSLQLKRNNENWGETVAVTDDGSHEAEYTWSDLLRYAPDSSAYVYTVDEPTVAQGYIKSQDGNVITNTFVAPVVDGKVTVFKEWVYPEGIEPPDVKPTVWLKLYRQVPGGEVEEVPITEAPVKELANGVLQVTWDNLTTQDLSGGTYRFTVKEGILTNGVFVEGAPKGYVSTVSSNGLTVTNTYDGLGGEKPVAFTATKKWVGMPKGEKGTHVALKLYRNDEPFGEYVVLKDDGSHETSHTWNDLLRYAPDSTPYKYRVDEPTVPIGYVKTQEGNVITNTYKEKLPSKDKLPSTGGKTATWMIISALVLLGCGLLLLRRKKQ